MKTVVLHAHHTRNGVVLIAYAIVTGLSISLGGLHVVGFLFCLAAAIPIRWLKECQHLDRAVRAWKQMDRTPTEENRENFMVEVARLKK